MDKLPRFTAELIYELDEAIPYTSFPHTQEGIADLSERAIRRLAFQAGQRALIDDLLTLLNEDTDGNRSSFDSHDGSHSSGVDDLIATANEGSEQDE